MSEKKITLGIDLGTTYSAMAYVDENGNAQIIPNSDNERITPSVVYFESENNIIVGQNAKDEMELSPDAVVAFVKREMGKNKDSVRTDESGTPKPFDFFNKRYAPEEISSLILKKLKKDAESYFQGQEVNDVIITVPAYFNDAEKKSTKDAGEMAGFNVLQVINEPTAAAIAYGVTKKGDESQKVFVFDLGGGTFDVTVLDIVNNNGVKEINIVNTDGDHRLGGKDWDDRIIKYMADEYIAKYGEDPREDADVMADMRTKAEKIKKTLSEKTKAKAIIKHNNTLKLEITRDKFEELTADLMSRIEGLCDSVLRDSKFQWSDIDTILLAGGSTRMPMVREMLKRISGKEIETNLVNPDECVAIGAAIQSTIVDIANNDKDVSVEVMDKLGKVKVNDITSHTLGIVSVDENGNEVITPMIKKGTKIPFMHIEKFGTLRDNQSGIKLIIKEGESTKPDNATTIQEAEMVIKNPLLAGSPIEITFDIAADGTLIVIAKDITNNEEITVKVERNSNMSEKEIKKSKNRLMEVEVS